ncbi:hypothetical protein HRbin32_01042 [bacterium HR32]|jgi:hypothetical protein|nr:hypothetical protein HRbin32_01042 [bacterium HR32]
MRSVLVWVLVATTALTLAPGASAQTTAKPEKVAELRLVLRDLLAEHVHWSRMLVLASRAGERAAARAAEGGMLANARALGEAVASFYGAEAGRQFARLFEGHSRSVKEYLDAALGGRPAAKKTASERAVRNAQDIDAFLSGANPNLPKGTVLNLLAAHWAHHVAEIEAAAKRDWDQEARVWEDMRKHIYAIADALAQAIAKQFPDKFQ